MADIDQILSIVASLLSICATIISIRTYGEVKKMRDGFTNVRQTTTGNGNAQVVGSGNKVNTHEH